MKTKLSILVLYGLIIPSNGFVHWVDEGSVGIKYANGKLGDYTYQPGMHFYIPFFQKFRDVNIRVQVDDIGGVICTAKEGSKMEFRILVNNQLLEKDVIDNVRRFSEVYDKFLLEQPFTQKLTEWCTGKNFKEIFNTDWENLDTLIIEDLANFQSNQKTNLIINSVTVFKPKINKAIQDSFDKATNEKAAQEAEIQVRLRALEEERTKREIEEAQEYRKKRLAEIENEKHVALEKTESEIREIKALSEAKQSEIDAEAKRIAKEKEADAESYYNRVLSETESVRLTPEYLQKHWQENVLAKATAIYGEKVPTYYSPYLHN